MISSCFIRPRLGTLGGALLFGGYDTLTTCFEDIILVVNKVLGDEARRCPFRFCLKPLSICQLFLFSSHVTELY